MLNCMNGDDVTLKVVLVRGHVVAQMAGEAPALVHCLHMNPQMALLCGNVVALVADVAPSQMNLSLVQLEAILGLSFVFTSGIITDLKILFVCSGEVVLKVISRLKPLLAEHAVIVVNPMDMGHMGLEVALLGGLEVAEVTRVLLTLVDGSQVSGESPVGGGLVVAVLALVAEVFVTVHQVISQRGLACSLVTTILALQ